MYVYIHFRPEEFLDVVFIKVVSHLESILFIHVTFRLCLIGIQYYICFISIYLIPMWKRNRKDLSFTV